MAINLALTRNQTEIPDGTCEVSESRIDSGFAQSLGNESSRVESLQTDVLVSSRGSEAELRLVQQLFFMRGDNNPHTVVFCGIQENDGAAEVCARVAEILSSLVKQPVCLVDADNNSPTPHWKYDIESAPQCADSQPESWTNDGRSIAGGNLTVLPASVLKKNGPVLFPADLRECTRNLRKQFGYVVICASPLAVSTETLLLGQMTDGIVLVVKSHSTQRALALKAKESLDRYKVKILGAVLNQSISSVPKSASVAF